MGDPLSLSLELANTVAKIVLLTLESMPPEVRAERSRIDLENLKIFLALVDKISNLFKPKKEVLAFNDDGV